MAVYILIYLSSLTQNRQRRREREGEWRAARALITVIKAFTEPCLDVFIKLITKLTDESLDLVAIGFPFLLMKHRHIVKPENV